MDEKDKGFDGASDVTHSTAFLLLDTLVDEGQIVNERAAFLKEKFKDLHNRVLTIYKRDNSLLKRARELRTVLDEERQRVQSKRDSAQKDDQEIQKLKNQLVIAEQELTVAQERESVLQVEALEYDRKKQNFILEKEDAVAAEEARLRPKMMNLQEEINEMGEKVKLLVVEYEKITAAQKEVAAAEVACKEDIINFSSTLSHAKQLFSNVEKDPDRARKQLELVVHSLGGAQKEIANVDEKLASQEELIAKLELKQSNRATEVTKAKESLESLMDEIDKKRKTLVTLNTSLEVEIETRQAFQERAIELDHLIKATKISSNQETDAVERVRREKERTMKEFTNIEQATDKVIFESQSAKDQLMLVEKEISNIANKRKEVEKQIVDAKKDVSARTKILLKEQSKEGAFVAKGKGYVEEIEEIETLLQQKKKQEEIRTKEHDAINKKLTSATRECARETSRSALAKNELNMKEMYCHEIERRRNELDKRLDALLELFQKTKRERGEKASQIQAISQKMSEVAEKSKILENELEVLLREASLKEKELLKKKRQTHEMQQSCSMMRLEKSKQKKNLDVCVEKEQEIKSEVRRLNNEVAQLEESMISFRKMYEKVVDNRNQTGINLIDRNDEMSLLVEKVRAQEVALEHGIVITNARSEDIRRIKVKVNDLLREIEVCQRSLPKVKQLEEELQKLTEEIEDERWKAEVVEKDLTDPNNVRRWNKIESNKLNTASVEQTLKASASSKLANSKLKGSSSGTDVAALEPADGQVAASADTINGRVATAAGLAPSDALAVNSAGPSEEYIRLKAKCQDLEARVNNMNEKLREKDLIYAEVSELSERIGSQAEQGKEHTLQMAKQVNQYQNSTRNKTRQIMSTIAELSLFQSSSVQAQKEVERLEEIVAQAEERMAEGKAPFLEAEEEYEREKERSLRYSEQLRRMKEAQNSYDGPRTTAEVRPNAYIPEDDMLGVPRPYGPYAPFKPTVMPHSVHSTGMKGSSTPPPAKGPQTRLSERSETPPPRGTHF